MYYATYFKTSLSLNPITVKQNKNCGTQLSLVVRRNPSYAVLHPAGLHDHRSDSHFSVPSNPTTLLGYICFPSSFMWVYWSDISTAKAMILTFSPTSPVNCTQALYHMETPNNVGVQSHSIALSHLAIILLLCFEFPNQKSIINLQNS